MICASHAKEVTEMVKTFIVFVIAIVFLVIAFMTRAAFRNEILQMGNYKRTQAIIDRVVFSDTGNAKYYVSFEEDGNVILAETNHYSSEIKSLNPGDEVKIGYYFIKRGTPRAVIYDERLIPVSNSVPWFYRFMTIVGILLLFAAAAMSVRLTFF